MVGHREAMKIIARTLEDHPDIPEEMSFLIHEADPDGQDANVAVPLIEMQDLTTVRDDPSNDNLVDYLTDDEGNRVGYVYESKWEMDLQMDIWTASGSSYDVDQLGRTLREILYTYDSKGPHKTFERESGENVSQIYDFTLQERGRADSLSETPSVKRWRQTARVRGAEQLTLTADEPPIRDYTEATN